MILLDVMLPKEDGFQVCRNLRASKNVPIILVSAKREDMDKIRGLGLGANDYIVKPFNPSELIARVKSQIANYERLTQGAQKKENLLQIENLMIDLNSHEVFLDGESLVLPNKEFELLVFLAKNPNIVFSKDQLFEKIWGLEGIYIACAIAPFSSVPFGYLYIKSGIWKRSLVIVKERED